MPGAIKQMVQNYLSKHVTQVSVNMETVGNTSIDHQYVVVEPIEKLDVLMHFLNSREGERGIIFCKTKAAVNKLAKNLAIHKFSSGALHGSLTQPIRDRIMGGQFREGHIKILVATDLAARGLDVKEISYVVNYHLPDVYETYVHRSGRTARAGANGFSLTVLQKEEEKEIADFENELGLKFTKFKKADAASIEENNSLLWAKKIFKTKPNHTIPAEFRDKIHTVFHHLTKEELVDKILANHLGQTKNIGSVSPEDKTLRFNRTKNSMANIIKNRADILEKLNIHQLNPMQEEALSVIQNTTNTVLLSPTGTGKTLAFLLPLIDKLDPELEEIQALILVPSRELAIQIEQVIRSMGGSGYKVNAVYGGRAMSKDKIELKHIPAILIGTPGRIADHFDNERFSTNFIKTLVLDEFDKSLETGFEEEMKYIINLLPALNKRILTSATQGVTIPKFVRLDKAVTINYLKENTNKLAVKTVVSPNRDKLRTLLNLLNHEAIVQGLSFVI